MIAHLLDALRWAADQPCKRSNCGTACLCGPCSARRSLAVLDPAYRPKYRKNFFFPVRIERDDRKPESVIPGFNTDGTRRKKRDDSKPRHTLD
jgi:hypothetical protein